MRTPRLVTLVFVLVIAAAIFRLWRSPHSAGNLEIGPDSIEYAVAAGRFVDHEGYTLLIDGVTYPPRYPPWFSVGLLAPAIFLARGELGAAILPVFALAVVAVAAAYAVGRRLAGEWGGAVAAIALLLNPAFATLSRVVMTDVPALAFSLAGCWLYLRSGTRRIDDVLAGLVAAAGFALRTESLALLIPFAWRRRRSASALGALLAPSLLVAAGTGGYNLRTFGGWFRSGYDFWCPVPYEVPGLTLGAGYVAVNLERLLTAPRIAVLLFGAAGAALLLARRPGDVSPTLRYAALAALPGSLLHLFYFYPETRFHLGVLAFASVLGGAAAGSLAETAVRRKLWPVPIVVALAAFFPRPAPDGPPLRRIAAETMARETPDDAVIISGLDPVFLSPWLVRNASRIIVPASRTSEYADKLVAPRRIGPLDPPPNGHHDHRASGLRKQGALDPCPVTATEARDLLPGWLRSGRRVFIDAGYLPKDAPLERILDPAVIVVVPNPRAPWLGELRLRE